MRYERIHLKDSFPFLGEEGCDPTVELYLPYNMKEMGREKQKRPCLIVCPGGGYEMCSEREAEPIALHFCQRDSMYLCLHIRWHHIVFRRSFWKWQP